MSNILVAGLINIETTMKVDSFPIKYEPVDYCFFGIESTVSGVGYNVAKAFKTLGSDPKLLSMTGKDMYSDIILNSAAKDSIDTACIKPVLKGTPQSIIFYDRNGKRKINLDLKDIQDVRYPKEDIAGVFDGVDMAVICNINFARDFLPMAKKSGKPIATDVHVLDSIDDEYNKDFMENADILFLSNEKIAGKEKEFITKLKETYACKIIVTGLGDKGSLIYVRENDTIKFFPSVVTRKTVSTIGAGDSMFSSFVYFYNKYRDPYAAMQKANIFASYKIGEKGAAEGFLTEKELDDVKYQIKYPDFSI